MNKHIQKTWTLVEMRLILLVIFPCFMLPLLAFNRYIIIDFLKFFQPGHFQTVWVSKVGKKKRSIWYANLKSRALSKKCSILKWVSEDKEKETIKWIYACVIRRHLTSLWVVRQLECVQYLKFRWVILNLDYIKYGLFPGTTLTSNLLI